MRLAVEVWRQHDADAAGGFETYEVTSATPEMSLLELLDMLNAELVAAGGAPVAFDHDCREGICGSCGMMVNGRPHGPEDNTPACLQRVRSFSDGDRVRLEPFRGGSFTVLRDLAVDRSGLDRVIASGGYTSTPTNAAPEAASLPANELEAAQAMDYAACIGCGACVAACPNGAAQLFAGAKIGHLVHLPQGRVERYERVRTMVEQMEDDFGYCTNYTECVPACPAAIPLQAIAELNRERRRALWHQRKVDEAPEARPKGWLARLRTGPWWQSDPDDRPMPTER